MSTDNDAGYTPRAITPEDIERAIEEIHSKDPLKVREAFAAIRAASTTPEEIAARKEAHSAQAQAELNYVLDTLGEMKSDAPKPDFVTVVAEDVLHEIVHLGEDGKEANAFIYAQDIVNDDRWDCDDTRRVFGFRNDKDGRKALQMLGGWVSLDTVWKRAADGTYQPFDMDELGDNPHAIDLSNPGQCDEIVRRVLYRHGVLTFPLVLRTSRKPIAAALEQM